MNKIFSGEPTEYCEGIVDRLERLGWKGPAWFYRIKQLYGPFKTYEEMTTCKKGFKKSKALKE